MRSNATTPDAYIKNLPADRKTAVAELRKVIKKNLPKGFVEVMQYGMITYAVPHSLYPAGYHCKPEDPLPFLSVASQKNFISVYHMGVYGNKDLLKWYLAEYSKFTKKKTDNGKSCFRFKKAEDIPYKLIGELAKKITPKKWIEFYEKNYKK